MFVKWRDIYKVGIGEIDKQHMTLFAIINDLHEGINSGAAQANLNNIFGQLMEYAADHFSTEEDLLEKISYPGATKHTDEHGAFIAKIQHCQMKSKLGHLMISMRLMDFLKDWIIDHILGSDQEYAEYLKQNNVSTNAISDAVLIMNSYEHTNN